MRPIPTGDDEPGCVWPRPACEKASRVATSEVFLSRDDSRMATEISRSLPDGPPRGLGNQTDIGSLAVYKRMADERTISARAISRAGPAASYSDASFYATGP